MVMLGQPLTNSLFTPNIFCSSQRREFYADNEVMRGWLAYDLHVELFDYLFDTNLRLTFDELFAYSCLNNGCNPMKLSNQTNSMILDLARTFQTGLASDNINQQCSHDLSLFDQYPFSFFDSYGKLVLSGYLQGNLKSWGRSDQCFATQITVNDYVERDIGTDFCLGQFNLGVPAIPVPLEQGICVPDSCKSQDVNGIVALLNTKMDTLMLAISNIQHTLRWITFQGDFLNSQSALKQVIADYSSSQALDIPQPFKCHERVSEAYRFSHPSKDPLWATAMALLLFFVILSVCGTTIDLYFMYADRAFDSPTVLVKGQPNPAFEPDPKEVSFVETTEEMTEFGLMKQAPSKQNPSLARFGKVFSIRNNVTNLFDTYRPKAVIKVKFKPELNV